MGGEVAAEESVECKVEEGEGQPPGAAGGGAGTEVVEEGLPLLQGKRGRWRLLLHLSSI